MSTSNPDKVSEKEFKAIGRSLSPAMKRVSAGLKGVIETSLAGPSNGRRKRATLYILEQAMDAADVMLWDALDFYDDYVKDE